MSDSRFELAAREDGDVLVISVAGHVDSANAEEFHACLDRDLKAHGAWQCVILDFEALDYISSAGLRSVLMGAKILHARGKKMALCSLSEAVHALIRTVGFDKVIDVYGSRAEAVSAVTG